MQLLQVSTARLSSQAAQRVSVSVPLLESCGRGFCGGVFAVNLVPELPFSAPEALPLCFVGVPRLDSSVSCCDFLTSLFEREDRLVPGTWSGLACEAGVCMDCLCDTGLGTLFTRRSVRFRCLTLLDGVQRFNGDSSKRSLISFRDLRPSLGLRRSVSFAACSRRDATV